MLQHLVFLVKWQRRVIFSHDKVALCLTCFEKEVLSKIFQKILQSMGMFITLQ
jgi:hypothetical protein